MKRLIISSIKGLNSLFTKNLRNKKFPEKIERILVVAPLGLGDVLICTPAIRALCQRFPKSKIDVLAHPWSAKVLLNNPHVDKTILREGFYLPKLIGKYDLAINFGLFLDNAVSFFAGCKFRVGYEIEGNGILLHRVTGYRPNRHVVTYALDVVKIIGATTKDKSMEIFPSKQDRAKARKILVEKNKKIIVLAPGGGNNPYMKSPWKVYPSDKFIEYIASFHKNYSFVLVGDKNDTAIAKKICKHFKQARFIKDLTGQLSIHETAVVIEKANLFVGNDSFLMHVASAVGVPVISLFGPTNPLRLAPLNKNSVYLKRGKNISKISPQEIKRASLKLLGQNKKKIWS